ncbi:MAG: hypothetical protein HY690_13915 [Chloroflexi bacterium]|nr:hypothetical protein [Chloroflexota bacterium]
MPLLIALHATLANSIILYLLLVGLWGLGGYFRGFRLTRNYTGALVIGEIVLVAQGVVGLALVLLGVMPGEGMHFLYGVASVLGLPLAHSYAQGRDDRQILLIYSLATLFVFGLAVRALTTAT